jgi:signal transduction histidine kinase
MIGGLFQSLRARLIAGAVIWIAIGVTAAGFFIAALFREYAIQIIDTELQEHLGELITLIQQNKESAPEPVRALSDPRFNQVGSGFTWQVSQSGRVLVKSPSTGSDDVPIPDDELAPGEIRKLAIRGPRGPMTVYERLIQPGGTSRPPMRVQIGSDDAIIDQMLPAFNTALLYSLSLLAAALMLAAAMQVGFGLKPMSGLRQALRDIKAGKLTKLPTTFASEVRPLVDDLNDLIEVNAQLVVRARAQAGNLAHALKTPLAVLTDEAYRLEGRNETESAAVILQQSQRMQRQIDYQLARARAAASRSAPGVIAPVASTATAIITAMKRLHAAKNLKIDADIDPKSVARCDPLDLNEMLANLIDNACKWASQTVLVTARVQSNPTCVAIAIEDDGLGLPEESMEVVFGIGERLDERVPGSGLGLPIVRDLAHLYGGSIRLERSSMGGLKAVLTLPWTS